MPFFFFFFSLWWWDWLNQTVSAKTAEQCVITIEFADKQSRVMSIYGQIFASDLELCI